MPSRIEDYALIGDCHTAALVARDGSIDWLCLPRFDSGACFAALLGTPEHGRWLLAPRGAVRSIRRRYREGTLVLETDYETDEGAVTVIDCMPPRGASPPWCERSWENAARSRAHGALPSASIMDRSSRGCAGSRKESRRSRVRTPCSFTRMSSSAAKTSRPWPTSRCRKEQRVFRAALAPVRGTGGSAYRSRGSHPAHRALVARVVGPLHLRRTVA